MFCSFWTKFNKTIRYTGLDDVPRLGPDGLPIVLNYHGDFHVDRVAGKIFDYMVALKTPSCDAKYSILFDYDAITHNEPIVRVESRISSLAHSILNHHYVGESMKRDV